MKKKILSIVGARPQFIKAAAVSRLLRNNSRFSEILVHTGQHYDNNMSPIFFKELELPQPDYNLNIGSSAHGKQTGEMLHALEQLMIAEKPDWVLIYGDTNSTLAGALAAAKLHIPIAHVEAGLRSFNRNMPEEINRIIADQLADILLVPTLHAVKNLQKEGFTEDRIRHVGDVMYDVALYYGEKAEQESKILNQLDIHPQRYVLATVHRQENTDDKQRLLAIMQGLSLVAKELTVILPLHPRTRKMLAHYGMLEEFANSISFLEPVGFLDMMLLEKHAAVIATDSGGVQKEAFFYQVPCVTLRDETEWLELVEMGWNTLVPPRDAQTIAQAIHSVLAIQPKKMVSPYGKGDSASRIIECLNEKYQ